MSLRIKGLQNQMKIRSGLQAPQYVINEPIVGGNKLNEFSKFRGNTGPMNPMVMNTQRPASSMIEPCRSVSRYFERSSRGSYPDGVGYKSHLVTNKTPINAETVVFYRPRYHPQIKHLKYPTQSSIGGIYMQQNKSESK